MAFVGTIIVSTKVDREQFRTLDTSEGPRAQAALSHGGGEAADRRGEAGAWRFGRTRGTSAWSECESSVWLAAALSARAAGARKIHLATSDERNQISKRALQDARICQCCSMKRRHRQDGR
jgi:hypothetical protein